ncbi:MAG: FadR family transcriptional regulator [Anaerolineae bacterium]|nr:MAG: FadR family transcriptional regulator [Anaerolineae bacterium]
MSEQISRQLLAAITSDHYREGDRLPPERDLADMFQASRVAVREALMSLAAKGILTVEQGRGSTVNPRPVECARCRPVHAAERRAGFRPANEVRQILEPEMAALAARATPEQPQP